MKLKQTMKNSKRIPLIHTKQQLIANNSNIRAQKPHNNRVMSLMLPKGGKNQVSRQAR